MKPWVVAIIAIVLAGLAVIYFGLFNVAATNRPNGALHWLLVTVRDHSVSRRADDIAVPDLTASELRRAGANDFAAMCAECHTAPGDEPSPLARGLNPRAPDLAESAKRLSEAEIFWTIKNGIRMSGMPAWGPTHSDDELWPLVAFIEALPQLDASAYANLLEAARGEGHHDLEPTADEAELESPSAEDVDSPATHQTHPHQH